MPDRALDIGCAVGRSAFELCCTFSEVIGIDYSKLFIDTCNLLKDHGHLKYAIPIEGELIQQLDAKVNPELVGGGEIIIFNNEKLVVKICNFVITKLCKNIFP